MKYRKKPVEVEVFQYNGDLKDKNGWCVPDWAVEAFEKGILYYDSLKKDAPPTELFVKASKGGYHVSVGDYVIKGDYIVKGLKDIEEAYEKLYPCNQDIFKMNYEKVENSFIVQPPLLKIANKIIRLDDYVLDGVIEHKVKDGASQPYPVLELKMYISEKSEVEFNV